MEKEQQEIERIHNMTEEDREREFKSRSKLVTNLAPKGKYKFLQKYYHRGAFYLVSGVGGARCKQQATNSRPCVSVCRMRRLMY